MRLVILYHPQSDHIGLVDSYAQDFRRFKGRNIERISLETIEGAEMAKLYDIVRYPALLVIGPNGSLAQQWQGTLLPLMDQLSYYSGDPDEQNISHQGRKIDAPVA
jgi:hypothetical protein